MNDFEKKTVEELSAEVHAVYQEEAKRQGDVRHNDAYADLAENIKEFDRVLVRWHLAKLHSQRAEIVGMVEGMKKSEACSLLEEFGYHGKDCWDDCWSAKNVNAALDTLIEKLTQPH